MRKAVIEKWEYEEIIAAEKLTQDKQISRRLRVLMLRYKGLNSVCQITL